jgi:hypothetical protein
MASTAVPQEYDARLDSRKRVTIRRGGARVLRVRHRNDGSILLRPLSLDEPLSEGTLRGMDAAVKNLRAGKRAKPVDLKKLAAMKF